MQFRFASDERKLPKPHPPAVVRVDSPEHTWPGRTHGDYSPNNLDLGFRVLLGKVGLGDVEISIYGFSCVDSQIAGTPPPPTFLRNLKLKLPKPGKAGNPGRAPAAPRAALQDRAWRDTRSRKVVPDWPLYMGTRSVLGFELSPGPLPQTPISTRWIRCSFAFEI